MESNETEGDRACSISPEMVDRAAQAAYEANNAPRMLAIWPWSNVDEFQKDGWRVIVRAALTAALIETAREAQEAGPTR